MSTHKHYLDVTEHPKTVNHDPEFYYNHLKKTAKPYVRMIPPVKKGNPLKKQHQENKIFGLICVASNCNYGDVHRHPDREVYLDV